MTGESASMQTVEYSSVPQRSHRVRGAIHGLCVLNVALFALSIIGKVAESADPALLDTWWAKLIAFAVIGFLLTLPSLLVLTCVVLLFELDRPARIVYAWIVIASCFEVWMIIGLLAVLFPR